MHPSPWHEIRREMCILISEGAVMNAITVSVGSCIYSHNTTPTSVVVAPLAKEPPVCRNLWLLAQAVRFIPHSKLKHVYEFQVVPEEK